MTILARLAAACLVAAAVAAPAQAARDAAPARPATPKNLKGFLLRADEPEQHSFPRTPSFAWSPVRGATSYTFQLSTSKAFTPSGVIWSGTGIQMPAVSIPLSLPWITGEPYSLYARVRAVVRGKVSTWSARFGFNVRWPSVPGQLPSYPGLIRWTPIEGATAYEVWEYGASATFMTTTNVADERDFYSFHNSNPWISSVRWRVRAVRTLYGALPNALPRTTVGPWSPIYTSVNPPFAVGDLQGVAAVSDVISTPGDAKAHELTPGFVFTGNQRDWGLPWFPNTPVELFHVYVYTDEDCVNPVYASAVVGSPAYAPRMNATLKLPANQEELNAARNKFLPFGKEGAYVFMLDGRPITATEANGTLDQTPSDDTGGGSGSGTTDTTPKIDLWDTAWPNGGYYWTVVPTMVIPNRANPEILEYRDNEMPQDACQAGHAGGVLRFGKVSQPVLTSDGAPYVSGLSTRGRLVTALRSSPTFYGHPLVAWKPALGADLYEIQWSKKTYPWAPVGKETTPSTSIALPLDPGKWYYRVRGRDFALPGKAPQMSWSKPILIRVAKPTFRVVG